MDIVDKLRSTIEDSITRAGIQVYVKTDLGGEVKVYDSADPKVEKKSGTALVKYAVIVKNNKGKILTQYGDYPKTNYFKMALVVGVVSTGLFITLRGIKSVLP